MYTNRALFVLLLPFSVSRCVAPLELHKLCKTFILANIIIIGENAFAIYGTLFGTFANCRGEFFDWPCSMRHTRISQSDRSGFPSTKDE